MAPASTVSAVGHYCGRFGPGILGEPLNSFSNVAFLIGAALALRKWRSAPRRDPWFPALCILAALIGAGSFIFHSHPTPATLAVDTAATQAFALAALGYVCVRHLDLRAPAVGALVAGFFLLRQWWVAVTPRGALGGAITHVPAIAALAAIVVVLSRRGNPLAGYLLASCGSYAAAIFARTWDLPLCPTFPYGLHWMWHLLTALAASLIVYGAARIPPPRLP